MSGDSQKRTLLGRVLSSIQFLVSPNINTEDRRSVPRIKCRYPIGFLTETGAAGEGQLLDVSAKGFRLRTTLKLSRTMTLAVNPPQTESLSGFSPLMAQVVWSASEREGYTLYGMALPAEVAEERTWLEEVLDELGYRHDGSQRRQHIRANAKIAGQLQLEDDETEEFHSVSVLNLGMGGALIRCEQTLEKNRQFRLTLGPFEDLPELELRGTILRVSEQPEENFTLHPSRFRPLDERDNKLLREYILTLLGGDD